MDTSKSGRQELLLGFTLHDGAHNLTCGLVLVEVLEEAKHNESLPLIALPPASAFKLVQNAATGPQRST